MRELFQIFVTVCGRTREIVVSCGNILSCGLFHDTTLLCCHLPQQKLAW